jgi:predicted aspartyl protease
MNSFGKRVVKMGLLSLLSVMPLAAQIDNGVDFTTSFPFYAGNAKMPAGSYKISQTDIDSSVLQIQSSDGAHSALVEFIPTHAEQPHPQSDVTFHKYGDTDYLNRIWVNGQRYGMKVDPTKAETKAAANANVVEHSIVANNR